MRKIVSIDYRELNPVSPNVIDLPSLLDWTSDSIQADEEAIAYYLEKAPAYSGVGKVVGDVLNPNLNVVLFPGTRTDGIFLWPNELAYYVRTYHVRIPPAFLDQIRSRNFTPPTKGEINWESLDHGFAT